MADNFDQAWRYLRLTISTIRSEIKTAAARAHHNVTIADDAVILENSLGAALEDHPYFSVIFTFCLLGLILVVSTLGMVGREGRPGEIHWSESSRLGWLRRIGAIALFLALIQFTSML